jgi:hypothetical protein
MEICHSKILSRVGYPLQGMDYLMLKKYDLKGSKNVLKF